MRDIIEKASHCAWQIHYHIVFPVEYRRGLLDETVVKIILLTAKEIEERYDIEFEQIGCDKDHVLYFVRLILKLHQVRLLGYSKA